MRRCGLWISPWVDHQDRYYIVDTAALGEDALTSHLLSGPDPLPTDTILVVVHPSEYERIRAFYAQAWAALPIVDAITTDPNGRAIATSIVNARCISDRELAKRLHWYST